MGNDSKEGRSFVEALSTVLHLGNHFLNANFLPSILISAVVFGLLFPSLGQQASKFGLSKWATFGVFLISGLTLRTSELGGVLRAQLPLLFGVVSSLFISPSIAVLVLQVPINPQEFVNGLALFCCMPTTLSSGVLLTQAAGANTALALSLTLISNLLGIFTMPVMISKLVAPNLGFSLPAGSLIKSLVQTSLIPLVIGKVIRLYGSGFIDKRKEVLSKLSAILLGLVPFMQASCGRNLFLSVRMQNFLAVTALGMAVHCVFLLWNILVMSNIKYSKDVHWQKSNAWAIVLTASQKTLPVVIVVIGSVGGLMGEPGLLVLPCMATHITQIIIDSFLVRFWIEGATRKESYTFQGIDNERAPEVLQEKKAIHFRGLITSELRR
ncbi:hypothetical protein GOP47_0005883 [Adiantum capillus-veneris]|uniref:Sodium/metabolite cotransporter BASS4, chloroplastic n=1 Tax=Adiantum capillus-veneris TaxID=13818 RepID=A0A9D4V2Q5_ADICA|nr:hypothetical protein GOP47_0005883 [Adiantum capillus-veneris]